MKTRLELETLKREYESLALKGRKENTKEADKEVITYERLITQINTCINSLDRFEQDCKDLINLNWFRITN